MTAFHPCPTLACSPSRQGGAHAAPHQRQRISVPRLCAVRSRHAAGMKACEVQQTLEVLRPLLIEAGAMEPDGTWWADPLLCPPQAHPRLEGRPRRGSSRRGFLLGATLSTRGDLWPSQQREWVGHWQLWWCSQPLGTSPTRGMPRVIRQHEKLSGERVWMPPLPRGECYQA